MLESIEDMYIEGQSLSEYLTDDDDITNDYFIVNRVYGRGVIGRDSTLLTTLGKDGAYPSYSRFPVRQLTVEITMKAPTFEELRKKVEKLAKFVNSPEEREIRFADEMDRRYYGMLDDVDGEFEDSRIFKTTLTFVCSDPYKYGEDVEVVSSNGTLVINNEGYTAFPTIELEAKTGTTFALVSDGENYNIIGEPADVDSVVVNEKTVVLDELGDTLGTWTPKGSQGSFTSDSNGIYVNSYGTGGSWHGPSIEKEIDPIEDFEVEFFTSMRTERDEMTFRTSLNIYDENMNDLGLLRVWDKSNKRTAKIIEGRIGAYTGVNHVNYLISSNNYFWQGQRAFNGILRVSRRGDVWTFYAAHITQRGNHIETITRTYHDKNKEFAGKLKFIRVSSAIFGTNPIPNASRIERVTVRKLNTVTVDQTPYIVGTGDTITFDHHDRKVLINGEPRLDLKNFGGTFFGIPNGTTSLLISPEDAFNAKVTFTERYI